MELFTRMACIVSDSRWHDYYRNKIAQIKCKEKGLLKRTSAENWSAPDVWLCGTALFAWIQRRRNAVVRLFPAKLDLWNWWHFPWLLSLVSINSFISGPRLRTKLVPILCVAHQLLVESSGSARVTEGTSPRKNWNLNRYILAIYW